ncbi:MAG TPA: hypothetical protein VFU74_21840 [Actinocrinis sp.]|nr:hypothetical protein [Actinocrinis sp.]
MTDQPTPQQLAADMKAFDPASPTATADMERIVRAAEAGGIQHMKAVAEALAEIDPPGASPTSGMPAGVYEVRDGQYRPALHESNVMLELRVWVNGRLFTARESIDQFMFKMQFSDESALEPFIRYFIQSSCGRMAADPDAYRYFRSLVWIVRPDDEHDLKRCAEEPATGPRCDAGLIVKERPPFPSIDGVTEPPIGRSDVLGVCSCRCHRRDGTGVRARHQADAYGFGVFDESQLREEHTP